MNNIYIRFTSLFYFHVTSLSRRSIFLKNHLKIPNEKKRKAGERGQQESEISMIRATQRESNLISENYYNSLINSPFPNVFIQARLRAHRAVKMPSKQSLFYIHNQS